MRRLLVFVNIACAACVSVRVSLCAHVSWTRCEARRCDAIRCETAKSSKFSLIRLWKATWGYESLCIALHCIVYYQIINDGQSDESIASSSVIVICGLQRVNSTMKSEFRINQNDRLKYALKIQWNQLNISFAFTLSLPFSGLIYALLCRLNGTGQFRRNLFFDNSPSHAIVFETSPKIKIPSVLLYMSRVEWKLKYLGSVKCFHCSSV